MKIMCAGCHQPIDTPDLGQPQIMNLPTASILVVEHSTQVMCPNCKVPVVAAIAAAQLALVGALIPAAEQKSIILAPNGMKVN
jgi:hypothetical protein